MSLQPPPLALYIHVPWCLRKCPYCDFNSHPLRGELDHQGYVDALIADLEQELPEVWGRRLSSIFIGGGTPSLLDPAALDRLLATVRALLPWSGTAEITMEANPGAIDRGRFAEFFAAGVNRLSIGVQSFDDEALLRLGRVHDRAEAIAAVELARAAGCDNLNLDLMFGLPGQGVAGALADLEQAIALDPDHLSYYQLTIEPNTAFEHTPPTLPDEEVIWAMQQQGVERLADFGYGRYEVSAYARPGRQCRHNLNYWQFGDYLGIGPGAHAKITRCDHGEIVRRWKVRHPQEYLATASGSGRIAGEAVIATADLPFEFMMNALRLREGIDLDLFETRTGLPRTTITAPLAAARQRDLLGSDGERIVASPRGYELLNDLLQHFI